MGEMDRMHFKSKVKSFAVGLIFGTVVGLVLYHFAVRSVVSAITGS